MEVWHSGKHHLEWPSYLAILNWCFLLTGLVAIYYGLIVAVWIAWILAMLASMLAVSTRRWLYALALFGLMALCVLIYLFFDRFLAQSHLGGLPYADDLVAIVPVAGISMWCLFPVMAAIGRYAYQHNGWEFDKPFSRSWVPDEMQRRERDREQER